MADARQVEAIARRTESSKGFNNLSTSAAHRAFIASRLDAKATKAKLKKAGSKKGSRVSRDRRGRFA